LETTPGARCEPGARATAGAAACSVRDVQFSRGLRNDVLAGDITLSVRLWKRPQVKEAAAVRRAGEPDRETLRDRAAHAGPIDEDTLVYRIELHPVSDEG